MYIANTCVHVCISSILPLRKNRSTLYHAGSKRKVNNYYFALESFKIHNNKPITTMYIVCTIYYCIKYMYMWIWVDMCALQIFIIIIIMYTYLHVFVLTFIPTYMYSPASVIHPEKVTANKNAKCTTTLTLHL